MQTILLFYLFGFSLSTLVNSSLNLDLRIAYQQLRNSLQTFCGGYAHAEPYLNPILNLFGNNLDVISSNIQQIVDCNFAFQAYTDSYLPSWTKLVNKAQTVSIAIPRVETLADTKSLVLNHYQMLLSILNHRKRPSEHTVVLYIAPNPDPVVLRDVFRLLADFKVKRLSIPERCEVADVALIKYAQRFRIEHFECKLNAFSEPLFKILPSIKTLSSLRFLPGSVINPMEALKYLRTLNLRYLDIVDSSLVAKLLSIKMNPIPMISIHTMQNEFVGKLSRLDHKLKGLDIMIAFGHEVNVCHVIKSQGKTLKKLSIKQLSSTTHETAMTIGECLTEISEKIPNIEKLSISFKGPERTDFSFLKLYPKLRDLTIEMKDYYHPPSFTSLSEVAKEIQLLQSFTLKLNRIPVKLFGYFVSTISMNMNLKSLNIDAKVGIIEKKDIGDIGKYIAICAHTWRVLRDGLHLANPTIVVNGYTRQEIMTLTENQNNVIENCKLMRSIFTLPLDGLPLVVPTKITEF